MKSLNARATSGSGTTNTNTPVPIFYWYWCICISSKHYVPGNDLGTLVTIGTYSIGTGVFVLVVNITYLVIHQYQ
jgi:hypothetical protein